MKRSRIDEWMQQNERIVPWNRKAVERYQLEKLNEMLAYCRQHSAFYSYLPERIDSLKEIEMIPLMTEKDFIANAEALLLVSQRDVIHIVTDETSATTGKAKRIFYTEEDQARTVDFFSCGLGEFICAGDSTLVCMPGGTPGSIGSLVARAVERLGARATVIGTDKTYREMINALQASEANTIVAMPIPLLSFARYMKAERVKINLTGVLVSADTCTPEVEAMLREELDCEIYPHYGSRESGLGGAITCPAHAGMHLWESDLYVEIIDEAGNVLPVGSQGEIVLTTLRRQAMPLIRYRTGDVGVIYAEECSCGSIVRRLKNPRRRNILVLDIADADSVMFSHKQLLDYRIALSAEGCSLEAVIVKPIDEVELKKSLAGLLPDDMVLKMSVRRYNAKEERPFFSKKRVIL